MSLDARPRDLHGRFAPSTVAESDVTLEPDVNSQIAELSPTQVEPLLLEDDGDDAMAADVISALRRHDVSGTQTWQQALNKLTGALPGRPGLVEMPVRESCFSCSGRGMDEIIGGECPDCGGSGTIFADRILQLRYAPEYRQSR